MAIHWLTAFLDYPSEDFSTGASFWQAITASTMSPPRGIYGEFATLLPTSGDAYVRVQRLQEGPAKCHLDVHVDDIEEEVGRARDLGASVDRVGHGITTMHSPSGLDFCVVSHHGEHERPSPSVWGDGLRSILDQVSIDVAPSSFDAECEFWKEFSRWPLHQGSRPEFAFLTRAPDVALRLLFQRVEDVEKRRASAHLDFACNDVEREARRHVAVGARVERVFEDWTTMRDPAHLVYCITRRDPDTGLLAGRRR
jgi:hypothetical protein